MTLIVPAVTAGFLLDALLGDPPRLPHPVRLIGKMILAGERGVRRLFPDTPPGKRAGGCVLAVSVILLSWGVPFLLLYLAGFFHPLLKLALESVMCYQIFAAHDLAAESMRVYRKVMERDLNGARRAVSMIVGRDTAQLTFSQITRAAVETVAENTCDGVVAPLFFTVLGGAPLGWAYKAVNTMDSMIGYRNERYMDFGRFAAKLDDAANFLAARLSAAFIISAAFLLRIGNPVYSAAGAAAVYRRDRMKHASPNSAHCEAACAGALGIRLAGDAFYGGVLHSKPTIGNNARPIVPEDIRRANRLMYAASILALLVFCGVRLFVEFMLRLN